MTCWLSFMAGMPRTRTPPAEAQVKYLLDTVSLDVERSLDWLEQF